MENMYTFVISNESHTMGNILSSYINDNNLSRFASYRVPHPLCQDVHVTIKASTSSEATRILMTACSAVRENVEQGLRQIQSDNAPLMHAPFPSDVSVFKGDPIRNGDMK